jgi:hypothetical protein
VRNTNGVCALAGLLIALSIVSPATGEDALQFCWVQGRYDLTIYYAETEGRDDRSEALPSSCASAGSTSMTFHCKTALAARERAQPFEAWRRRELEIIDTTFMSDLDS